MTTTLKGNRAFHETCTRRGQAFGLLTYYLNNEEFVPKEVMDTKMNKNYGRIMSLGASYYGCHMGLTGLSF